MKPADGGLCVCGIGPLVSIDHGTLFSIGDSAPPRSMRFSSVRLLEVNLRVVVSLFLLRVTFPRPIGLLARRMIGLLAWIIFRCLFAHGIPLALHETKRRTGQRFPARYCPRPHQRTWDPNRSSVYLSCRWSNSSELRLTTSKDNKPDPRVAGVAQRKLSLSDYEAVMIGVKPMMPRRRPGVQQRREFCLAAL